MVSASLMSERDGATQVPPPFRSAFRCDTNAPARDGKPCRRRRTRMCPGVRGIATRTVVAWLAACGGGGGGGGADSGTSPGAGATVPCVTRHLRSGRHCDRPQRKRPGSDGYSALGRPVKRGDRWAARAPMCRPSARSRRTSASAGHGGHWRQQLHSNALVLLSRARTPARVPNVASETTVRGQGPRGPAALGQRALRPPAPPRAASPSTPRTTPAAPG